MGRGDGVSRHSGGRSFRGAGRGWSSPKRSRIMGPGDVVWDVVRKKESLAWQGLGAAARLTPLLFLVFPLSARWAEAHAPLGGGGGMLPCPASLPC